MIIDLFGVHFNIGSTPVDDIETWVHEFSELSVADLIEEDYTISIMVDVLGLPVLTTTNVPHIMVSLHTLSEVRYTSGSEKVLTPDEFAFQILGWKNDDEVIL